MQAEASQSPDHGRSTPVRQAAIDTADSCMKMMRPILRPAKIQAASRPAAAAPGGSVAAAGGGGGIVAAVLQDHALGWAILVAFIAWLIHNIMIAWLSKGNGCNHG